MIHQQNSVTKKIKNAGGNSRRHQSTGAEKEKSVARLGHSIRTPLSVVMGISEILAQSRPLTAEQEDYIEMLRQSSGRLKELFEQMLALCAGPNPPHEAIKDAAEDRTGQ